MIKSKHLYFFISILLFEFISFPVKSESNSSTVTNSVSPSASSTTTGGSSINYQTNQSFNNDVGVGPGVVCRTPSLNIGTSYATADNTNWASLGNSGTWGNNIAANVGIVIPFGSGVHDHCEKIASQISLDKRISTQLSMIKACASLEKEGIQVDVKKFPLLKDCKINFGEPNIVYNSSKIKNNVSNIQKKKISKSKSKILKVPLLIDPI